MAVPHSGESAALLSIAHLNASGDISLTLNVLVDRIEASHKDLDPSTASSKGNNKALIRRYLINFIRDLSAIVADTFPLPIQDQSDAVKAPHQISVIEHITLSPFHNRPIASPLASRSELHDKQTKIFDNVPQAFKEFEGRLLLLGSAGAGKTTSLLQFAIEIAQVCLDSLDQADGYDLPIPVFGSIHQWDHQTPIKQWANTSLQALGVQSVGWRVIYLFDGLDELGAERLINPHLPNGEKYDPRVAFLDVLATQLEQEMIVVSCRAEDYGDIAKKAALNGAVSLMPFTPNNIESFLIARKQTDLWEALQKDERLLEVVSNPLLLSMVSSVFEGDDLTRFRDTPATITTIFNYYIEKRFIHEDAKKTPAFTESRTREHLSSLGASMWLESGFWRNELTLRVIENALAQRQRHLLRSPVRCTS